MATRLLVGPTGSGKTSRAVKIFSQFTAREREHSIRFIVPTITESRLIRQQLLADPEFPGLLGDPVCTFYAFASDILNRAMVSGSSVISDMQKRLMLKEIIGQADPGYFDGIKDCPSFPEAIGGVIDDLKLAAIAPEDLAHAVASAGRELSESSKAKLLDLTALYKSYQNDVLLAHNLHDHEGVMWRALDEARKNPELLSAYKYVILDGFAMLTPVQKELIRLLSEHCAQVVIGVGYEPDRPSVFECIEPDMQFFAQLPDVQIDRLPRAQDSTNASLAHIEANLFAGTPQRIQPDDGITILSGATPSMEIELVAGQIKRLVRAQEFRYTDIGVIVRGVDQYAQKLASTFRQYNIPLTMHDYPLRESALARTIALCMRIVREGWKREHVLAALKSTYTPCDPVLCSRIENTARSSAIQSGREVWFAAWRADDDTLQPRMDALQPIADFESEFASPGAKGLCAAVQALFTKLRLHASDDRVQEDYSAWKSIKSIMADIVQGEETLGSQITPDEFANLLESGIRTGSYHTRGDNAGGVSLVNASAIAGRKFRVVFVIGLIEKAFPRQVHEDPFLHDFERAVLNRFLPHKLDLRADDRDRERYLFYSAVSSAQNRLFLCYPSSDISAKDSLPSFYLDEVYALFTGKTNRITRDLREVVPATDQAETAKSLIAGTVLDCCANKDSDGQENAVASYNLLLEKGLISRESFDWLSERPAALTDTAILDYIRTRPPVYRVTALETYGVCPFRYFCDHELKLSEIEDEAGMLQRGAILHKVLYRLYTVLFGDGTPSDMKMDDILKLSDAFLNDCMSDERLVSSMPAHLRKIERNTMAEMLSRFLVEDIARIETSDFTPAYLELEFGTTAKPGRDRSASSVEERLKIPLGGTQEAELVGKIDRVDLTADGSAMIVDYKTGACPDMRDIENGTLLQAPLYSLALRKLFHIKPVGAEYCSLKKSERKGIYADDAEQFEEKIRTAIDKAVEHINGIRRANIEVAPVECPTYCGLKSICRIEK